MKALITYKIIGEDTEYTREVDCILENNQFKMDFDNDTKGDIQIISIDIK